MKTVKSFIFTAIIGSFLAKKCSDSKGARRALWLHIAALGFGFELCLLFIGHNITKNGPEIDKAANSYIALDMPSESKPLSNQSPNHSPHSHCSDDSTCNSPQLNVFLEKEYTSTNDVVYSQVELIIQDIMIKH